MIDLSKVSVSKLLDNYDKRLLEMLTGKLLGDGSIIIDRGRSPRFRFGQAAKDRGWCLHNYQMLSEYIKLSPPKYRRIRDERLKDGYSEQYYVQSSCDKLFLSLKEMWYSNRKKILPRTLLSEVLTPLCLAWWYQDDGHLKTLNNTPKKIILSTESFDIEEISYLSNLLLEKYNLDFSIDKQKRLLLYDKPSILYFLSIVRPYIVPCMNRKDIYIKRLDPDHFLVKQRTTLYISSTLKLIPPTKRIKEIINKANKENFLQYEVSEVYHFYTNCLFNYEERRPFQIDLSNKELYFLAQFQLKYGLKKGECVEFCYHYNNLHT